MASEARALLNEQIAELNSLRDTAIRIYTGIAAIPAIVRQGPNTDCIAGHLALLVTDQRANLPSCLDGAEYWLGPTNPVYVPIPGAEGERPSACAGAGDLLQALAILCQLETGDDGPELPTDFDTLAGELAEKWGNGGIPDWVLSTPVDGLLELAEVARRETDAAIERLTRGFQATTTTKTKRSKTKVSPKGDTRSRILIIAALNEHHQYSNGKCEDVGHVGVNKLARHLGIAPSTVSSFFKTKFGGHDKYRIACGNLGDLANSLRMLNGELTPSILFNRLGDNDSSLAEK